VSDRFESKAVIAGRRKLKNASQHGCQSRLQAIDVLD
jgi:hypothetical protein